MPGEQAPKAGGFAVVVLAHDKPRQLRRLIDALDVPIFLHIDANTPEILHGAMTEGLPSRVRILPRLRAGWGAFALVEAELSGYRAALAETTAEHVVLLSGADYPLASTADIAAELAAHPGRSFVSFHDFPQLRWGLMGGYDRFIFWHRPWRGRRLWIPVPRPWPRDLRPSGGSQSKILARPHIERLLDVLDRRPDILRFFRSVWIPDETLIASILSSPKLCPGWAEERTGSSHRFYIDWPGARAKNPAWLTDADLPALLAAARSRDEPALFARKFSDDSSFLTARIDEELRTGDPGAPPRPPTEKRPCEG